MKTASAMTTVWVTWLYHSQIGTVFGRFQLTQLATISRVTVKAVKTV